MIYVAFIIICMAQPGYAGDPDTGSTCRKFYDLQAAGYTTLRACERRVLEMEQEVFADRRKLSRILPGPWRYKGHCDVEVLHETVM